MPGLLTGGVDGKRGHIEEKRLGYLIRKLGFSDPARQRVCSLAIWSRITLKAKRGLLDTVR